MHAMNVRSHTTLAGGPECAWILSRGPVLAGQVPSKMLGVQENTGPATARVQFRPPLASAHSAYDGVCRGPGQWRHRPVSAQVAPGGDGAPESAQPDRAMLQSTTAAPAPTGGSAPRRGTSAGTPRHGRRSSRGRTPLRRRCPTCSWRCAPTSSSAGDTVRTIAQQFGVTNETIIWENDLTDPDTLEVGQELHILPFSGLIHEVRPGDTVASVANSYDALVKDVISRQRADRSVRHRRRARSWPYRAGIDRCRRRSSSVPDGPPRTRSRRRPSDDDQVAALVSVSPGTSCPYWAARHRSSSSRRSPKRPSNRPTTRASRPASRSPRRSWRATGARAAWRAKRTTTSASRPRRATATAGSVVFDVWEVIGGRNVMESQAFRAYTSVAESFVDHGRFFLENGRYAGGDGAPAGDARQFAREVNRAGYATDPAYASKLIGLMDRYDLYRYDDV